MKYMEFYKLEDYIYLSFMKEIVTDWHKQVKIVIDVCFLCDIYIQIR